MDDARRAELLKRWPAPWAVKHGLAMGPAGGGVATSLRIDLASEEKIGPDLAAIVVEAFNAHFGCPKDPSVRMAFYDVSRLVREGNPEDFSFEEVMAVISTLKAWKDDSIELARRRREEEAAEKVTDAEIEQAFADLARQDCHRGAQRLGRLFGDWTDVETKMAGEILFMELRRREAIEVEVKNDIPSPLHWESCDATLASSAHLCVLPKGHVGQHASKRMEW